MQLLLGSTFKDEKDGILPFTLRDAVKQALLATFEDERNLSLDEKVKRYDLYLKVKEIPDPAEFTSEEVVLMKKLVGKAYGVLIVGQAVKFLEGKYD
jgi:hypothetical protein